MARPAAAAPAAGARRAARTQLGRIAHALRIPAARARLGELGERALTRTVRASDRLQALTPRRLRHLRLDALPLAAGFVGHELRHTGAGKLEAIAFLPRKAIAPTLLALGASPALAGAATVLAAYPTHAAILIGAKYRQLRRDNPGARITPATVARALRSDWQAYARAQRGQARRRARKTRSRAR